MKRIIVLGGFGFFGAAVVERLRADGVTPLIGSRRAGADVRVDVEDLVSLRSALRPEDVVIDTVGPFQDRTMALVQAAMEIGFDVVDISDSFAYVSKIHALKPQIDQHGVRVLPACSSISAVSAALVRLSGIEKPVRVTGFLAPASRYTAVPATGASLLRSVGQPIQVLRHGKLMVRLGWAEWQTFEGPPPIGHLRGYLFESADSFTLPQVWPSLRTVEFYLDTRVPALNAVFAIAVRSGIVRKMLDHLKPVGLGLARRLGATSGCLAYEIEGPTGNVIRYALVASDRGYFTPIVPAVMAGRAIAEGRFEARGLVSPDQHVAPEKLIDYLRSIGVDLIRLPSMR